jgi:hypothetical protein
LLLVNIDGHLFVSLIPLRDVQCDGRIKHKSAALNHLLCSFLLETARVQASTSNFVVTLKEWRFVGVVFADRAGVTIDGAGEALRLRLLFFTIVAEGRTSNVRSASRANMLQVISAK